MFSPPPPTTLPDALKYKTDVLTEEEYAIADKTLELPRDRLAVLLLVVFQASELLHQLSLPQVPAEDIYTELLPMFLGVPINGHNQALLSRKLDSVVLAKSRETGEVSILLTLDTVSGPRRLRQVVTGCPDLWTNEPESAAGRNSDLMVCFPVEYACKHASYVRSQACKEGHVHRSIFHLGEGGGKKFELFEERLVKLHENDLEPEEGPAPAPAGSC